MIFCLTITSNSLQFYDITGTALPSYKNTVSCYGRNNNVDNQRAIFDATFYALGYIPSSSTLVDAEWSVNTFNVGQNNGPLLNVNCYGVGFWQNSQNNHIDANYGPPYPLVGGLTYRQVSNVQACDECVATLTLTDRFGSI